MTVPAPQPEPVEVDAHGNPVIRCLPAPTGDWPTPPKFDPATFPMPDLTDPTTTTTTQGGGQA